MEIKRRFQKFSQKDQKLVLQKKNFFSRITPQRPQMPPTVHLGHLSHIHAPCHLEMPCPCPTTKTLSINKPGAGLKNHENVTNPHLH